MWIPEVPQRREGAVFPNPTLWCGESAPDGDAEPWMNAALGSLYIRRDSGNVVAYIKEADTDADGDWHSITTS